MSVDERARHELYLSIEELIGAEKAETLMSLLPPVGWADVATKHDLEVLGRELHLQMESLEHRFESKLHEALNVQMRTIIFSLIGAVVAMGGVNLTATLALR